MAIKTFWISEDNRAGIDLNFVQTSVGVSIDPSVPAPRAKIGDRVQGDNGSEWLFVQASSTVTAGMVVAIDTNHQARDCSIAMLSSFQYTFGVANFQPNQLGATVSIGNANGGVCNAGDFFWACMRATGQLGINALSTCAQGANRVFINIGTPGCITTTASNSYFLGLGVVGAALATTTVVTPIECVLAGWLVPVSVTA